MRSFVPAVFTVFTIGACADSSGPAPSGLEFTRDDGSVIEGSFAAAGSIITFESRLVTPEHATLRLDVNGAVLTVDADFSAGLVVMDGGLNALYDEDVAALLALRDTLSAARPGYIDALHGTLLVRYADRMADAPIGWTLDRHDVDLNEEVVDRAATCGNDGTTCLPGIGGTTTSKDDVGNGGTCTTRSSQKYGNQATSCQGRCGAGCNWTWDDDMMQDCLDHDKCVDFRGGSTGSGNANCGDEFWDADGDWVVTVVAYCPN